MKLINRSVHPAELCVLPQAGGDETLVVVVKGTWRINPDGTLGVADEQVPIVMEPIYHGAVGASTLLQDTEMVLEKPGTDCILLGKARAPQPGVRSVDVTFGVGTVRKIIRLFGERIWMKCLWKVTMSRPVPFESIPLLWERSFGGADTSAGDPSGHEYCLENPIGRGIRARSSRLPIDGMRLPNLEDPAHLIRNLSDRPHPVCFAPIPAHWAPRSTYAASGHGEIGKRSLPLPSTDVDPRFAATAAPGLATRGHLVGNEMVLVENAAPQARMRFPLPGVIPRVSVSIGKRDEDLVMALDTVTVEPDAGRVALVWRGKCLLPSRILEVRKVAVRL